LLQLLYNSTTFKDCQMALFYVLSL